MAKKDILNELRKEDLERSGLNKPSIVKKLGFGDMLSHTQTEAQTSVKDAVSYIIPYYSPRGEDLKYHHALARQEAKFILEHDVLCGKINAGTFK